MLHIQVRPFKDQSVVFERELPVKYVELRYSMIADRVVLRPGNAWNPAAFAADTVEVLNVRDRGRNELVCRHTMSGVEYVRRVRDLDADSRLAAVARYYEMLDPVQEIWVDYDLKGEQRRLRMSMWGQIREDAKAGAGSPPELLVEEMFHPYSRGWPRK
jgi:hypothetical protein